MGKGGAMGSVAGFVCAMCAVANAFAAPGVREVEENQLIPDTYTVSAKVVVSEAPRTGDSAELDASVKRMMRLGFSILDMHAIPVSRISFRYGLPVDEQASRDDKVNLTSNGSFAAGTMIQLQRDMTAFRELAGRQFFREDAVPGLKYFPTKDLHVGAGVMLSLDRREESSKLFGVPFLAIAQVGVRF